MSLNSSASLLFLLSVASCSTIDTAVDCHAICQRYGDCYDSQYNISACETQCRSHSSDDSDYRRIADTCHACITNRDCTAATFSCATECISVVP